MLHRPLVASLSRTAAGAVGGRIHTSTSSTNRLSRSSTPTWPPASGSWLPMVLCCSTSPPTATEGCRASTRMIVSPPILKRDFSIYKETILKLSTHRTVLTFITQLECIESCDLLMRVFQLNYMKNSRVYKNFCTAIAFFYRILTLMINLTIHPQFLLISIHLFLQRCFIKQLEALPLTSHFRSLLISVVTSDVE